MKFQMTLFVICGIAISSQLTGNICHYEGVDVYCCANSENINGICKMCRNGTTTDAGGQCKPCKNNAYGYKCINKCNCDQFRSCHPELGCVPKTSVPTIHISYAGTIKPVSPSNHKVTAKGATLIITGTIETVSSSNERATARDTIGKINGTSNTEWIIYTLCVTGCFVLTCLCHLFRTYRKRYYVGCRKVNEEVTLQPLELPSYINDIYDEVDENLLTCVTMGINNTCQASHDEPVNFVFDARQSDIAGNEDDEAGYFDLYFGMNEDVNPQGENQAMQVESTLNGSSDSNVVGKDNKESPNLQIPLHGHYQDESHACIVAVMVHQCIESPLGSAEEDTSNIYSNVCKPLQKDRHINSQANENRLSQNIETKYDATLQTALPLVSRTGYFHDHLNKYIYAASDKIIVNCGEIESIKDKILEKNIPKTL